MSAAFYDIQHTLGLTAHQRRVLALGITKLHNTAFVTSRFSVHVKFTSNFTYPRLQSAADYFVDGEERRECNRIIVYIQSGGFGRQWGNFKEEVITQLAKSVEVMWDSYMCSDKSTEAKLHAIMVIPGTITGWRNFELWQRSDSDRSCLTFGFEVGTPDIWDIRRSSDNCSTSYSECSSGTWENQNAMNNWAQARSESIVKSRTEELFRPKSRLSRKAKFYKHNSMT